MMTEGITLGRGSPKAAEKFDAGTRLFLFLLLVIFSFLAGKISSQAVLFFSIMLLSLLAGISGKVLRSLARLSPVFVLVIGLNLLFVRGENEPFFSSGALLSATFRVLRIVNLYGAAFLFTQIVSPEEAALVFSRLFIPISRRMSNRLAFYGFVALGFLPIFSEEARRIRAVQAMRGGRGKALLRVRREGAIVVPLLMSALRRSGKLTMAVEVRGIMDHIGALEIPGRFGPRDLLLLGCTVAVLTAAVVFL